jgi:hypothetical protein
MNFVIINACIHKINSNLNTYSSPKQSQQAFASTGHAVVNAVSDLTQYSLQQCDVCIIKANNNTEFRLSK